MTLSNWIEFLVIAVVFPVLIALYIYTSKKLDAIDGLGQVHIKKDTSVENRIDL